MRTKKIIMLLGVTMAMVLVAGGCKANSTKSASDTKTTPAVESTTKENTSDSGMKTESSTDTTVDSTKLANGEIGTAADTNIDIPMVALPAGITGIKSETQPNEELKNLIKDYMDIPDDFLATTRYNYNYVDLDGDGNNEIFVDVSGPYTSGSGGSSGMIVSEKAGKLHVMQNFTLINTPVIISDEVVNGHKNIIVPYFGNDKSQYSVLTYEDGEYTNVPDGKIIDSLDGIKGTAILANDFIAEVSNGIMGLNLAD